MHELASTSVLSDALLALSVLKNVALETRLGKVETNVGDITRRLDDSQVNEQMQMQVRSLDLSIRLLCSVVISLLRFR